MANSTSHFGLPYPIYGALYSLSMVWLDADGDPTDPVTPDTEVSKDHAGFGDCTNEVTVDTVGAGYITLTSTEMTATAIAIMSKAASGPKTTPVILYPRKLPMLVSGTAQAGAAGTITLAAGASAVDDFYNGCIIKTTGGTGGAAGAMQARVIYDYVGSTKVATVGPNNWETNPANDTTYEVYATEVRPNPTSNVIQLGGGEQSATDLKDFADTGYDPSTHKVQGVVLADTTTTNTDMRATSDSKLHITATPSSINRICHVFIADSTSAVGAGKTGLVYSDVTGYYMRPGNSSATAMTMVDITTLGTYAPDTSAKCGFKKVDDTNMPGVYEVHLPNNVLLTGVENTVVTLLASGAVEAVISIGFSKRKSAALA